MKQLTDYHSYLLRLWQEERNGIQIWRASLESVQTRERWSFVGLPEVLTFLSQQLQMTPTNNRKDNPNDSQDSV